MLTRTTPFFREVVPVVHELGSGSGDETAAMYPNHHRQFCIRTGGGRPDVEIQAILALGSDIVEICAECREGHS